MFTRRFKIVSKEGKQKTERILSIGVFTERMSELVSKDLELLSSKKKELEDGDKHPISKILLGSFIEKITEEIENLSKIKTFKFTYSITNANHNDKFDLGIEQSILKGRYKKEQTEVLSIDNQFFSDKLLEEAIVAFADTIIKTVVINFRNAPVGDGFVVTSFNFKEEKK